MWIVSRYALVERRWFVDGVERTTGSANMVIRSRNSSTGVLEYLQSDLMTLGPAPSNIALAFDAARGWFKDFLVPVVIGDRTIIAEVTHSDAALPKLAEEQFVDLPSGTKHIDIQLRPKPV